MQPPSVTITEAARRLGVSTKTIRRRIADGTLLAHRASGPGGFQYRVTDPAVLVVDAGSTPRLDGKVKAEPGVGQAVGQAMLELANRVAAAEVRAARAEWERDEARREAESLRRVIPAPEPSPVPDHRHRWWWPFRRV